MLLVILERLTKSYIDSKISECLKKHRVLHHLLILQLIQSITPLLVHILAAEHGILEKKKVLEKFGPQHNLKN